MRRMLFAAAASCLAVPPAAALAGTVTVTGGAAAGAATSRPCAASTGSATSYTHVMWIWMENHSYSSIIGSSQAPYINRLASECGLATNYHNISHPSLPNYIAATSGAPLRELRPLTSDCNPVVPCVTNDLSLFVQGETWKAYEDSMPANCTRTDSGEYAVRHNPPTYYLGLRKCATDDVPYDVLKSDLATGALPAFSFVTPNLIHDMHDGTVSQGDTWLSDNLPTILSSHLYTSGKLAVFVTWDEGEGGSSDTCADNTTDVGCHVATIVVSPSTTPGTRSNALFNHYSLLRTTEQLLDLRYLGRAASVQSMRVAFGL